MKRITRQHVLQAAEAAAEISRQTSIFIVGLSSIVFTCPKLQSLLTDDVDLFTPENESSFLDEFIAALGDGSPFAAKNGYYVERLGSWIFMTQPAGWQERAILIPHPTLQIRAVHPLDLLYNKIETGRKKDLTAAQMILKNGAVSLKDLEDFIHHANTSPEAKADIQKRFKAIINNLKTSTGLPQP